VCNNKGLEKVSEFIGYKGPFNLIYKEITQKYKLETGNTAASHNRFNYFKWIKEYLKLDFSVTEANDLFWKTYFSNMVLFEGVIEFLEFLKNSKIKIGLLTDFQTEYQYKKLEKLGILEFFDVIVTSEEVGIEKPSTKGFQYCLNRLGETSDKVIMIGDSLERDIKGAKDTGIYPILFSKPPNMGSQGPGYFTGFIPKVDFDYSNGYGNDKMGIFSSYKDLLKAFEGIKKDIDSLAWLSRTLGQRFDLIQAAGGNISIKNDHFMMIKSSGINLYDVSNNNGYSIIKNEKDNYKNSNGYHISNSGLKRDVINGLYRDISEYNLITNKKASMETYMHSYMKKYTIHLHPIEVNKILIRKDAKEIISKLFPKWSVFIDYVKPGVELSKAIYENIKNINNGNFFRDYNNSLGDSESNEYVEYIIFLANHGVIMSANTSSTVLRNLNYVLDKCEKFNGTTNFKYKNVKEISAAMNIFYKKDKYISYLVEDEVINRNIRKDDFRTVFPDKTIYCGVNLLYLELSENLKEIDIRLKLFNLKYEPSVFIIGDNIYITAKSMQKCREIESVLKSHLMVLENNSEVNYLSINQEDELLNMDEEKYRKNL
jgi:HAD superfamily hydrolase (TIGR01549 family)